MKNLIAILPLLISQAVFATASCPNSTQTTKICLSTPKAGDEEIASSVLDSIAVCSKGSDTILVMEKAGDSQDAKAKVTSTVGGINYAINTSDVNFVLGMATGIRPSATKLARLTVTLKAAKISASSTYTCK